MKKFFIFTLFFCLCAAAFAQGVSYITITDEDSYKEASDFNNTYEVNINRHGLNTISKCQAVRLSKEWFITAAHCIHPQCEGMCSMQVRLIVTPNYEMDITTTHSPSNPKVFKNLKANVDAKSPAYDIALLYFPEYSSKFVYKDPARHLALTESMFFKRLPDYNTYYRAANGTNIPTILAINSAAHTVLDRRLSVASIWDGVTAVLQTEKPVFYSPKLHYMFTENFGIRQGISGSGVMTNTGELAGIVSAIGDFTKTNSATNQSVVTPVAFFAAFDNYTLDFIKKYVGDIEYKYTDKKYLKPVPEDYLPVMKSIDNIGSKL